MIFWHNIKIIFSSYEISIIISKPKHIKEFRSKQKQFVFRLHKKIHKKMKLKTKKFSNQILKEKHDHEQYRRRGLEVFCQKAVLKNFAKFTGK